MGKSYELYPPGHELFQPSVQEATLNLQAIARGHKPLVGSIVPRPGHVFVGMDIESAEPTIIAQLSGDPFVRYFTFEGIGKKPFYKDGIFYCDDQYVSLAAMVPKFKDQIRKVFEEGVDGQDFGDFWINTPEAGKVIFKNFRKPAKAWDLGIGYDLGAPGLRDDSESKGFPITLKEAITIRESYWKMRPYVYTFKKECERNYRKFGYISTPFGFRSRPTDDYKCMNGQIQASVNPIINTFALYLESLHEYHHAYFVACIHDEIIWECPIELVHKFYECKQKAQQKLNKMLDWDIPLRFGFVVGRSFYEAKEGISKEIQGSLGINTNYLKVA